MIVISPISPGLSSVTFKNADAFFADTQTGRVQKVMTLDGEVSIMNHGVTEADRTFTIEGWQDSTGQAAARALYSAGAYVGFYCNDGAYKGMIETFRNNNGKVKITILAKEKIS
jgi:hypothetical protein